MDDARLIEELRRDEGVRLKPYLDTCGKTTIGVGRNLTDVGLSDAEVNILLANDIAACKQDLDRSIPWWRTLSDARQRAFLNLVFNLGIAGFLRFRKMIEAAERGDWETASAECLDSDAARKLPARYGRIASMLREG